MSYPVGNFTARAVSLNLQKEGLPVSLYKGKGYFYFVYDDGPTYDSFSVYTYRITDMPMSEWIAIGRRFAATVTPVTPKTPLASDVFRLKL